MNITWVSVYIDLYSICGLPMFVLQMCELVDIDVLACGCMWCVWM